MLQIPPKLDVLERKVQLSRLKNLEAPPSIAKPENWLILLKAMGIIAEVPRPILDRAAKRS